jgi:cytochrome c oxidase assembly protein subunit 15
MNTIAVCVAPRRPLLHTLVIAAALLALAVIGLGAYVRLSDAGLGCPDWPGCYGKLTPHHAAADIAAAQTLQPEGPVTLAKAWKEMLHRYLAGLLGALILAIALLAGVRERGGSRRLALALLVLVVVQAGLGMGTVILALRPVVVSAHLLGGMATLALLVWFATHLGQRGPASARHSYAHRAVHPRLYSRRVSVLAGFALAVLGAQIALGGWVSSHQAALACADFPTCDGSWWPAADWARAFHLTAATAPEPAARVAMHWAHRLGALAVALLVLALAWRLMFRPGYVAVSRFLVFALLAQISLGALNILASLPLAVAVAHNLGAALLLAALVRVNVRLWRG